MISKKVMLIAGEPSGDALAAELVRAFRALPAVQRSEWPVHFFGAGGERMAEAGVEVELDLTRHAVFGLSDVLRKYVQFRRLFRHLAARARAAQPDTIVLVDFGGFNLRFARAIRRSTRGAAVFQNWNPKILYYASPQVWASRPGRAGQLEADVDLLLAIFPFEKEWYARRAPGLRVEFVGHPLVDRCSGRTIAREGSSGHSQSGKPPVVLLLPGSRPREVQQLLPVMLEALREIQSRRAVQARGVLPNPQLFEVARAMGQGSAVDWQCGGLDAALETADLALACSGTVTLECAFFGLPTVVVYKTSWLTYQIGRRIIQVGHIAMPNILAGERLYPELIQHECTPGNLAREALRRLDDEPARRELRDKLAQVRVLLGPPGASTRAARLLFQTLFGASD